jgi:hypothetical protein
MKTIALLCVGVGLASVGCSAHYTVLSVPAMSMTTPSMPAGATATQAGRVESQFCPGDDPVVSKDANVGLIDEAVAKAQAKAGAQYLSDVTVSSDGHCIYVEGMAMK